MRIVHLITHLRLGAGRAIVDLSLHQAVNAGHEVLVVVATDAEGGWRSDPAMLDELTRGGVQVGTAGDFFHREARLLDEAAAALRTRVTEWTAGTVVHSHTAQGIAVARWAGAPRVVATCHGWSLDRPVEFVLQDALAFSLADAIASPSAWWAERVGALPGHPRVEVIPYGFDLSRYGALPQRQARPSGHRIACVGELTARKGQDVLLEAMPLVWERMPDAELHLFGDGDLCTVLDARAAAIDATGRRVVLHGYVASPYRVLPEYDLLVLPTRSDNQPVAIVEAMLAGLPIVSTTVGGIPEMIEQAACGEVVLPEQPSALAAAIVRMLGRLDAASLGERGRAFAGTTYAAATSAARYETLYRAGGR